MTPPKGWFAETLDGHGVELSEGQHLENVVYSCASFFGPRTLTTLLNCLRKSERVGGGNNGGGGVP